MSSDPRPQFSEPATTSECFSHFQEAVSEYLIRHRSVLDVMSKFQEANARVARAVAKATTTCGCVEIQAGKQKVPSDISYWEMKSFMDTHLKGEMCDQCREILEAEVGRNLFYCAALCELFSLDLGDVVAQEQKRITALGVFNLS
ncbi:MAG TPA: DUF1573 domain-containing protein [Limnochordia bacterium]|nr:DUF1573 domain-containing protein [Limnochordia bacterium]